MKKNKKIFLCGLVYDTAEMSAQEIEADIERRFNEFYKMEAVKVELKIEDNKLEMCLHRSFPEKIEVHLPYGRYNSIMGPEIFCIDQDLILGKRLEGNVCKAKTVPVGFGYYYSDAVDYFVKVYKKNSRLLKVRRPKDVQFSGNKDMIRWCMEF